MSTLEEKLREAVALDFQEMKEQHALDEKIQALREELDKLEKLEKQRAVLSPFLQNNVSKVFHAFLAEMRAEHEKENS